MTKIVSSASWFEEQILQTFEFLEADYQMFFAGVKEILGDPRDSGIVMRYRRDDFSLDVAWSEVEMSLAILIYLNRGELSKSARYLYLDSYVEFVSKGEDKSIIPQIYPRMSEKSIFEVIKKRQELFQHLKFSEVLVYAANRLHKYLPEILKAPADAINSYHQWTESPKSKKRIKCT